jgi:hypothetical protein
MIAMGAVLVNTKMLLVMLMEQKLHTLVVVFGNAYLLQNS